MTSEFVMGLTAIFALNLLNNTFSTLKTLYLAKDRYLAAGLANTVGTFFYLIALVRVAQDNNVLGITAMCLATFIGTYVPGEVVRRAEGDRTFIFDITADSIVTGETFAAQMVAAGLPVKSGIVLDKHMTETVEIKVFCQTKEESRIVKNALPDTFKWNIYVPLVC